MCVIRSLSIAWIPSETFGWPSQSFPLRWVDQLKWIEWMEKMPISSGMGEALKMLQNTYNWNRHGTMIQEVNDRIRTLAIVWANLLCSMMMGRAHLGSKISAFWWHWAQGFRWPPYSDSLHSYCSATCRSFWLLHSMVQVLHCIHSTLSVALPFGDSIAVYGYACRQIKRKYLDQNQYAKHFSVRAVLTVWDSRVFALWSILIRIGWSSGWWLIVVAVIINRFTRCTIIRVTTRWFRM